MTEQNWVGFVLGMCAGAVLTSLLVLFWLYQSNKRGLRKSKSEKLQELRDLQADIEKSRKLLEEYGEFNAQLKKNLQSQGVELPQETL